MSPPWNDFGRNCVKCDKFSDWNGGFANASDELEEYEDDMLMDVKFEEASQVGSNVVAEASYAEEEEEQIDPPRWTLLGPSYKYEVTAGKRRRY